MFSKAEEYRLKEKTVLIVDDEKLVRDLIQAYLKDIDVIVIGAESVLEAQKCLENIHIDAVLSDIAMPGEETGIDLLRWCREAKIVVPFVLISGFISPEDVRFALTQGVQHVLHKPFSKQQLLEAVISSFAVSDSYSNLVNNYIQEIELNQQRFIATIDGFAAAVGARDGYTLKHSEQVAEFAVLLSRRIGLDHKNVQNARIAGKLHDIGKIGVPENILLKKDMLTEGEFALMKSHSVKTAEILSPLLWLGSVISGARHHHERYDGTGYPDGLKGEDIPLLGRILAICDAFSAMITDRPYRPSISTESAREEIRNNSSTQFDPELVIAFLSIPEISES